MAKKNKIIFAVLCFINFFTTLFLTIFVVPNKIPFLLDIDEKILNLITKWVLFSASIIPTIFISIAIFTKNKKLEFILSTLFTWSLFENILYFSYFCISNKLIIGELCEIPISVSIFMPMAIMIVVFSTKLKNLEYLSKPALNFKTARETEFLWRQTHIFAKDVYFATGVILFFISLIFCFVRFCLIEFFLFVVAIIISTAIVYKNSKSIYKKYIDMKKRQDALKNKNKNNKSLKEN